MAENIYAQPADGGKVVRLTDGKDESLMGVRVEKAESFRFSPAVMLVKAGYYIPGGTNSRPFDISPDGQRFLMIKPVRSSAEQANTRQNLEVVQHWFEELKRLVPQ